MKMLALDFGAARIGVAIGDEAIGVAHVRNFVPNNTTAIETIYALIADEKIGCVLIGHPLGLDGGTTEQTKTAEQFAAELEKNIAIPVQLVDERFSSREAHVNLSAGDIKAKDHKSYIDSEAARILLQAYFDSI